MSESARSRPAASFVGVAIGAYDHFAALPRAVPDAEAVRKRLEELGFQTLEVFGGTEAETIARLKAALPRNESPSSGVLLILWSGHGVPAPESRLHLIASDSESDGTPLLTPEFLAGQAARTGASQVLMILDTCYAGAGAVPALSVVDTVLDSFPPGNEPTWFGVIASTQSLERARDGAFAARLLRLLREGPLRTSRALLRWSPHNELIGGDDLIVTLAEDWDLETQRPKIVQLGLPRPLLPNPLFDRQAPERIVEHLLLAARGIGPGEEGFYFTGRVGPLERIVAFLRADRAGIMVVTGPAGSGKSAVVGRVVSLSNATERARLLADHPLEHADPGEGSVHAHVHTRNLTVEQVVQTIDEQLVARGLLPPNQAGPRNRGDLLEALERSGRRPVIVIDGLDEAGQATWQIADDVLRLLAPVSKVLVGTRELAATTDGGTSLIQRLVPGNVVDLGEEGLRQATREDVYGYVAKRLAGVGPPAMDPAEIARAVLRLASEENEGVFLLARVVTAQLRTEPVDTTAPGWEARLSRSLADAFDRDLARIPPLRRGDHELPQAASELLAALTWGKGAGFPDDLWAIAASALSPTATAYTRDDVYWLLGLAGRYVVEAGEGGRSVYRLSHQRLTEHLRSRFGGPGDPKTESPAGALAKGLVNHYLALLEAGDSPRTATYLWRYTRLHCAEGGPTGIEALRRLVDRDAAAFLPDLARALNNLGNLYSALGRRQEAFAPAEEAVRTFRDLAAANPAFLPDLASALNNLGIRYSGLGRRKEALAPTEEAVGIYRNLAAANPTFLPDLASALNNLGIRYSELGRRKEALAPTEEAVGIYRNLAAANPTFLPDLAKALNNLGVHYSNLGRRAEALAPTEEAFGIYRDLATTNPALLPDLASALTNLGARYSELGRHPEALAPAEEAVVMYRNLATTNPAFLPDLAMALNNLGVHYSNLGRRKEALAPTQEAVGIRRALAAANPAFLNNLASALNNLGNRYGELGRHPEALVSADEAVGIRRVLATANSAFLPDLASALNNLGIHYSKLGRHPEALAPTEEAVGIRRDLAATNSAFLPGLASALNNVSIRYIELGCRKEALAPAEEAVGIYRGLAAANPAFLPGLARALNNLGIRYSALGRRKEALALIEEAVAIRRVLAAANPAFLPDLARALNNLGIRYSALGRRKEALAVVEEARRIHRDLVADQPGDSASDNLSG